MPTHRIVRAIGTTIGTPSIGMGPLARFWFSRNTMNPPTTTQATTRTSSRLIGRTGIPSANRRMRS